MKRAIAIVACLALCVGALCGCSSRENENQSAQTPQYATVGEKTDKSIEVNLTNDLGSGINELFIKQSEADNFSDNFLAKDQKIAAEETVTLYWDPEEIVKSETSPVTAAKAAVGNSTPTDAASSLNFDLLVILEDGTSCLFEQLLLGDYKEASLEKSSGICFVDYTNTKDKQGSTEQAATERKAAADAEIAAAEQAAAEAEAAAQAQAATQAQASAGDPVGGAVSGGGAAFGSAPAGGDSGVSGDGGGSAPSQSEDTCVGDIVFN